MRVKKQDIDRLRRGLDGRYVIGPEIGAGGMSTVFQATDIVHDREVALKVLAGPAARHTSSRFQREIRITAGLQHPHVLPLLDSGSVGQLHYFVTPYIAGESLSQHLATHGALPVAEALRLVREIAGALEHAHANDVVHLDVKPGNILLSGGHAMVADFGIARAVSGNCGETPSLGVPVGTPSYMSPEQVSGEVCLDGRSDVYALGCVLFEMLVGHPPFGDNSPTAVLSKHLYADPPSVRDVNARLPKQLDLALCRALAKNPDDRFPTMKAFARAIAVRPVAKPVRRSFVRVPRRARVASLGIAVLSLFGFGISRTSAAPPAQEIVDPLAAELEEAHELPAGDLELADKEESNARC